ncbi:hypothetical protein BZL30_5730 [Mycobacterium kansasii]|uniref:DUF222 domain-containing protein n=1 Tax=Mycobacterium kansasii TaxID=1768 RepID=A0A1V3WXZ8_MYCKA|nr:hypothetical protein BZL30_5730 [Mycobacterium kansasii]
MGSGGREEIVEVFDALDAELDRLCELSFEVLTIPERLRALERLERVARRLRAPQHALINQLGAQAGEAELGAKLRSALADRLRITKAEAGRRIDEAADLGPRRALTGEPLAPQLSATAAAQRDGLIGDGHVRVIRGFLAHLPAEVDLPTREAPTPTWPAKPAAIAATSWPSTRSASWTGSTPTGNCASRSGPASAASPSAGRNTTACRASAAI